MSYANCILKVNNIISTFSATFIISISMSVISVIGKRLIFWFTH